MQFKYGDQVKIVNNEFFEGQQGTIMAHNFCANGDVIVQVKISAGDLFDEKTWFKEIKNEAVKTVKEVKFYVSQRNMA